jgi:hypothetical protein
VAQGRVAARGSLSGGEVGDLSEEAPWPHPMRFNASPCSRSSRIPIDDFEGSGVGVLLTALIIPPLLARIRAERLLRFCAEYDAYCARTSRLIPRLY